MLRAAFIGRFQPFHLGHLATIKQALRKVDELVIVIGSAQKSHEMRNPFTAGERIEMMKESFYADDGVDIKKLFQIPVPDINIHGLWTHQVDLLTPRYKLVFTNDIFTRQLFEERGITVIEPTLYRKEEFSGTVIRSRMVKDEKWSELVTLQTANIIEDIHGVERLKAINALSTESH